jgi:hypothetical protein
MEMNQQSNYTMSLVLTERQKQKIIDSFTAFIAGDHLLPPWDFA